ncbi:carbohydrate ABC transporter permease [Actinomadura vinacea]|uniref:Carbohydrate ABC transporter permease n=1 Tax=Actinomadura vinacea TaxID=115336 RepID=A0ABN3KBT6_9ACTN
MVFLAPYVQMLIIALKPRRELMQSPPGYLPTTWEWSNFVHVWEAAPIATHLKVSLVVSAASTALALAAALPAAYYTARRRFRGRGAFLLLVLVTQMFAPTALLIGIYREMVVVDLTDTYAALILVNAAFNLPFSIWILHAYFSSIPRELEEAAWLDGCGRATAMVRVTLPLSLPGVVTAVIYTFIGAWNEYVVALTVQATPERRPLTVAIPSFVTQYQEQWQYLFATSLIAIVPVVFLFIVIERYLVSGLTAGGVK